MTEGLRLKTIGNTGSSWDTTQSEAWWETRVDDWTISLRLAESKGHLVVTEVRIFPYEGGSDRQPGEWSQEPPKRASSIPSAILRKANIARRLQEARAEFEREIDQIDRSELLMYEGLPLLDTSAVAVGFTDLSKLGLPTRHERRPGRKGHGDRHYAEYAYAYDKAAKDPKTAHKPVKVVAELMGESSQFVGETIAEARKRGLLTPAPKPGQPGGELTEKARRILNEEETNEQ